MEETIFDFDPKPATLLRINQTDQSATIDPISSNDVDAFINAKTEKELVRAATPLALNFFGKRWQAFQTLQGHHFALTIKDALECQSLVLKMLEMIDLAAAAKVEFEELEALDIHAKSLNLKDYPSNRLVESTYFEFTCPIRSEHYMDFLERGCDGINHVSLSREYQETDDGERYRLFSITSFEYFKDEMPNCKTILEGIIDALISVHLIDIRTVSTDGGHESRACTSNLSYIWFDILKRMRDGRVGKCEACGRPFIAKRERGKKRRFCTDACRQRAGKKRREQDKQQDQTTELSDK